MYLTQALHRQLRQSPDGIALQDARRTLTWSQLVGEVARVAGALRRDGLDQGGRVALLARNRVEFITCLFGTLWAGGVIVPMNIRWSVRELCFALRDCDARVLFVEVEFAALLAEIRAAMPGIIVIALPDDGVFEAVAVYRRWIATGDAIADERRGGDALAAIMYTGGTTGRSKGVMLSHANLAWSMLGTIAATNGPATRRHLFVAPLFHVGALSNLLIALATGAASRLVASFDPVALAIDVESWRADEVFLVPTMIRAVIDHPDFKSRNTSSMRRIRYGASPIDQSLLSRALAAFPNAGFVQGYGMTELSPVATILPAEDHGGPSGPSVKLKSAGRATASCEVRIVRDGVEVPTGEVGEIVVRGPIVMQGYWNLPLQTAEVIRGGWLHTGDAGYMDAAGYVTVVDRIKDMIITGGENVYSAEVEDALTSHGDVAQAAVIGLPDETWGEIVHAVIVLRQGSDVSPGELLAHCRSTIAGYKVPRSLTFVDALPLTGAGKPQKALMRQDPAYSGLGRSS